MFKIILADDHHVVREALRILLETQPDFRVVAECGDGPDVLHQVDRHRPAVLILDLTLPGLPGLEVARRVRTLSPGTRIVMLSMHDSESYVVQAIQAGAAGYVLKKSSAADLVTAIRQALAGERYLSPALDEQLILSSLGRPAGSRPDDRLGTLTPREREVFHLVADGWSSPRIAERLSLSVRTVEMHRGNLMKKLGVKSHSELIRYAARRGIL